MSQFVTASGFFDLHGWRPCIGGPEGPERMCQGEGGAPSHNCSGWAATLAMALRDLRRYSDSAARGHAIDSPLTPAPPISSSP